MLDIGCGAGEPIAKYVSERGYAVTGVDSSPAMIAKFRARLSGQHALVSDMRTGAKDLFEVLACQPLLLHPKLDRLDRVRRIHRIVLGLVGLDESRNNVEAVAFGRAGLCAPEFFDLCERMVVVPLTSNRL